MIAIEEALKGIESAQGAIRNAQALSSPTILSEQMMRLSQYAAILDSHLAQFEKDYEMQLSSRILEKMREGMKVTPAESMAKVELAETKAQILFLTRYSGSCWRQVGVAQSRINHLLQESKTNI